MPNTNHAASETTASAALIPIHRGARVRLDDGSFATAYPRIDGTYTTVQAGPFGGPRVDHGWRREQFEVVS